MALVVLRSLICDGATCEATFDGEHGANAMFVRGAARLEGWAHKKGRDLCPECYLKEA